MIKLAINGYGRIGRAILRALYERQLNGQLVIVAINEIADSQAIAHLTRYDSVHGRFAGTVDLDGQNLLVNDDKIALSHHANVADITWPNVDVVLECSGSFTDTQTAQWHLQNGAKKVLFSQGADADVDFTVVYGVNHQALNAKHRIVSNASCTTNACVGLLQLMQQQFGIQAGSITTLHSAMNDQPILDAYHGHDLRRMRSANAIIPIETGLARGIERILPELTGRFSAQHIRVPSCNVSALDISLLLHKAVSVVELNQAIKAWATPQAAIIGINELPLASVDFNHDSRSAIVDLSQTHSNNTGLVKLFVWFDNEWAFANRMLDSAQYLMNIKERTL